MPSCELYSQIYLQALARKFGSFESAKSDWCPSSFSQACITLPDYKTHKPSSHETGFALYVYALHFISTLEIYIVVTWFITLLMLEFFLYQRFYIIF